MSGMRMKFRSVYAQVLDLFKRGGTLSGSSTTFGSKTWAKVGVNTTVATCENGQVRATSGAGDVPVVLPTGTANFDMSFEIAELRSIPAMLTACLRVNTSSAARYDLVLRTDGTTPQYALAYLSGSTVEYSFQTGIVPVAGDRVRITVENHHLKFYLNGKLTAETDLAYLGTWQYAGIKFNGTDNETAIKNFAISAL